MYSALRHIPSIMRKNHPIQLTYFVTDRCNANCPYCFYLNSDNNRSTVGNELNLEEIRQISLSFENLLWLAFSGGEIFLRKDLEEISYIFYNYNKPVYMLYPTNGLMPNRIRRMVENIVRLCEKSVIVVKLSIDGLYEDQDELRNTTGSFEKTLQTYHLLSELVEQYPNFELGINTVFCAKNQNKMDGIIAFVQKLEHITSHTLSLVRGNLINADYKQVDYAQYAKYSAILAERLRHKQTPHYRFNGGQLKAAQDILQRKLIYQTVKTQHRQIPCFAGKANLVLSERGEVFPCEILNYSFGNLRDFDYDIKKVLQSYCAKHFSRRLSKDKCFCTHECHFMTNILLNPLLYPSIAREYIKLKSA